MLGIMLRIAIIRALKWMLARNRARQCSARAGRASQQRDLLS
jgi:hypothetical protein